MTDFNYNKLRVLIADDFSNFRSTVNGMLGKLGVQQVDMASNGAGVLDLCQRKTYDVILCDYDLGPGKNGQQVLEELRFRSMITRQSIFIVVSADAAKDVVMAAYDCEPDDYLMKPITAKMLQQRMARLLLQRQALSPIYAAIESHNNARAIGMLIDMSITESRYAVAAQKLLGEMFIGEGELSKAEKLYTKALQSRQVDWARLGLARVKQLKGELDVAGDWLEKIVQDNPLYLPAYDVLANNWEHQGDGLQVQSTVQRSVEISPKSILRQKKLAEVAEKNGDLSTALRAMRATVRLGELSCHATADDNLNFARVATKSVEKKLEPAESLTSEAVDVLALARERYSLSRNQSIQADLLEGRSLALNGQREQAKVKLDGVNALLQRAEDIPLELNIERIAALQALGEVDKADRLLRELLQSNAFDQSALEKLDALLAEPVSESNRAMVATVNREGIELYNQDRYDEAIECFERVRRIFPKHVGVHLNIVQSLIGKRRAGQQDEHLNNMTQQSMDIIQSLIEPGHSQYARFERLKAMATATSVK